MSRTSEGPSLDFLSTDGVSERQTIATKVCTTCHRGDEFVDDGLDDVCLVCGRTMEVRGRRVAVPL